MKIVAFDLETSISKGPHGPDAKDPTNDFYTLIYGDHPESINVIHNSRGFKRHLLGTFDISRVDVLIGHNMPFDLAYIIDYYKRESRIPNTWDSQLTEFLLSGQRHSFASLAELQELYLGKKIKQDRISRLYKKGIGADKIIQAKDRCPRLWKLYDEYCRDDGATVLKIFKKQYNLAKEQGMLPLIKMYNKFMVALVMMMSEGIHVDLINTEKTIKDFKIKALKYLQEAQLIVTKYWTDPRLPPFKILSPTHKSAILFGGHIKCRVQKDDGFYKNGNPKKKIVEELVPVRGFQLDLGLTHQSKVKGRYSTDKGVIEDIYHKCDNEEAKEYCSLQIEAMRYEKAVSTYLEPFLKYSINGKLFPHFNNTAVITGRLSSNKPNLQNVPSKGEIWKDIQGQLIAPEGWICVSADYSQLEIYIAAWQSGDEQLIKDLQQGLDFHCQSLAFAEQMSYEEVYHLCHTKKDPLWCTKRTKAKAITFQKEYGAGIKKVAEGTGLEVSLVEKVFDALDQKYWKLKLFKEYVYNTAMNNMSSSYIKNIPTKQRFGGENGRRFNSDGFELLPIMDKNNTYYDRDYLRNVGYYQTPHGKIYSFQEYAYITETRDSHSTTIRRSISVPQTKNYTSQGGAADVMAAISIELMEYCLKYQNEVKWISQIHDSQWLYVKEEKKNLHISNIEAIMRDVPAALKKYLNIDLDFSFEVETKIGKDFADMTVWDDLK